MLSTVENNISNIKQYVMNCQICFNDKKKILLCPKCGKSICKDCLSVRVSNDRN